MNAHAPSLRWLAVVATLLIAAALAACSDSPTPEPTHTPTSSPVPTATHSPTHTPTSSPVPTATPSPTHTPTPTATPSPTHTPTPTATPSPTHTPTSSPVPTATPSPTHTPTSSPVPTATLSPTHTPTPTAAPSPTHTPTLTPEPTATPTPTPEPTVKSPPPMWIFVGDIPEEHQTILREEMEASRAYFSDRFGVEATGFTVLVAADHEEFPDVYRDVTGYDIHYSPHGIQAIGWVTNSLSGGAVITLHYMVPSAQNLSRLEHSIVHEYFHVLQGQLITGFARLQSGEIAWDVEILKMSPRWLEEGHAVYADYAYTPTRTGRRPFHDDGYNGRYPVYEDIEYAQNRGDSISLATYGVAESAEVIPSYLMYPLGFLGTSFLVQLAGEDSYMNYWKIAGERPTWQRTFEEAFGIDPNDFYRAFDEWLLPQLPSLVRLTLHVRWPDKASGLEAGEILMEIRGQDGALWGDWETQSLPDSIGHVSGYVHPDDLENAAAIATYTEGAVGVGNISLWWVDANDQCTRHLLGWYKDGELTDRRENATLVEFTGADDRIGWDLPKHPAALPRLESQTYPICE